MYSEIIHTRCGDGVDIKKNQAPVSGGGTGGFKVYSCSDNVTDEGFVDLQFLDKALSEKQPYADPAFMDDAYLYYVPDVGNRMLISFHPIHFDRTAKPGNYPHRPGNFINQCFIGGFDDFYPYETFGNATVWDAKERGEAFYYESAPKPLPQRDNLSEEIGDIGLDDVAEFISDGRREALMNAIAFIVSQYDLPPEERKFLVVRDEDSRKIELWIAAIESAFSPRMASGLPFATRLNQLASTNKYTVNLNGIYQPTINLQSPDQKLRYRAMIVGVDERDRSSNSTVRVLPNSPFVILDGATKTLTTQADASAPYYRYATEFDDGHSFFCREFLQSVDLSFPSSDVLKLFNAYTQLEGVGSAPDLKDMVRGLNSLSRYGLIRTAYLENLYERIKGDLSEYLSEDASLSFAVLNWLVKAANVVGDSAAEDSFKQTVCRSFAGSVYRQPQSESTAEIVVAVEASSFALDAAKYLVSQVAIDEHEGLMWTYAPADWICFSEIFTKCLSDVVKSGNEYPSEAREMLSRAIKALYDEGDARGARRIASSYYRISPENAIESLLADAETAMDQRYAAYLVHLICGISPEIVESDRSLETFRTQLRNHHLNGQFPVVLAFKAKQIKRPQDMERFLDGISSDAELRNADMTPILVALDKNLDVSDKAAGKLAVRIQNANAGRAACPNSAHICALDILDGKRSSNEIVSLIDSLSTQGFPSVESPAYADALIKKLFSKKVSEDVFAAVVMASEKSAFYAGKIVHEAFRFLGGRQEGYIGEVIEASAKVNGNNLFNALVEACSSIRQFDKGMSAIESTLASKRAYQYFSTIEREAYDLHEQNGGSSIFGKLFSR